LIAEAAEFAARGNWFQKKKPRRSGAKRTKGTLRNAFFGAFRSGTNSERGDWFHKEKPRRVTGLRVMVGPVGLATNPTRHVCGPTRPNWGGGIDIA